MLGNLYIVLKIIFVILLLNDKPKRFSQDTLQTVLYQNDTEGANNLLSK